MESVWHTFGEVYKKGMVYRGTKIMPFSTACNTVLSNFEAGNDYRDVKDPAIIITFPILEGPFTGVNLIAWTTTPWTLPSNLATAVNPDLDYLHFVTKSEGQFICMKDRLDYVCKQMKENKKDITIVKNMKGKDLVGCKY